MLCSTLTIGNSDEKLEIVKSMAMYQELRFFLFYFWHQIFGWLIHSNRVTMFHASNSFFSYQHYLRLVISSIDMLQKINRSCTLKIELQLVKGGI